MANEPTPQSVDEYLQSLPVETRRVVEQVRVQVKRLAPAATERISYGIPTFDLNGQYLIYVAGWKNHISVYPVSAGVAQALNGDIEQYLSGKGTLKFPLTKPLPIDLIRRFVEIRMQEVVTASRGASVNKVM